MKKTKRVISTMLTVALALGLFAASANPILASTEGMSDLALSLGVPTDSVIGDEVEYTLSIRGAENVLSIELEFEVDGNMLNSKGVLPLSDFFAMGDIMWRSAGGSIWRGEITIGYQSWDDSIGFSSCKLYEIAKFFFDSKTVGYATMKLTGAHAVVLLGGEKIKVEAAIEVGEATTKIELRPYSKYDLNKDYKVDSLDLGTMLLYCGFKAKDPQWDSLVKVTDSKGNSVTASMCDVNSDGVVDMLDLIDLFVNYTK